MVEKKQERCSEQVFPVMLGAVVSLVGSLNQPHRRGQTEGQSGHFSDLT